MKTILISTCIMISRCLCWVSHFFTIAKGYIQKTTYSQILQNFPKLTELSKAKYKIRFCFHFIYRHAIFINRPKITFTRKKREVSFILIETTENQFPVEFFTKSHKSLKTLFQALKELRSNGIANSQGNVVIKICWKSFNN